MLARYRPYTVVVLCVCGLCVCVCVCVGMTHSGIVSKRLNVGSRKQCHTIARFSDAKDHGEIPTGSSLRGQHMQVGWVKIGHCRQTSGYKSKTVQDRRIVSIKVE